MTAQPLERVRRTVWKVVSPELLSMCQPKRVAPIRYRVGEEVVGDVWVWTTFDLAVKYWLNRLLHSHPAAPAILALRFDEADVLTKRKPLERSLRLRRCVVVGEVPRPEIEASDPFVQLAERRLYRQRLLERGARRGILRLRPATDDLEQEAEEDESETPCGPSRFAQEVLDGRQAQVLLVCFAC